jgi:hypothetical protein
MDKLYDNALKELQEIEKNGISNNNLDAVYKLTCIAKNILKIGKLEDETMYDRYESRRDRGYDRPGTAIIRYGTDGRGGSRSGGRYGHRDHDRMYDRMYRVEDGMDDYLYGKDRYYDGDNNASMIEGLEKMMYAICTLVETVSDAAETPEEKEVVRKHIQKIKSI